jgi:diacylglycerol kinase family enzyme
VILGVFNNRRAGGGGVQAGEHAAKVAEWLRSRRDVPHVDTDRAGIRDGLAELGHRGVDVLVVNGGDGTLQRVLTEVLSRPLFERVPMIAPLRSGRTNMSALDIGSRRDPVRALATLLEARDDGSITRRVVERPVMRVDLLGQPGPQFGLFIGFGVIHRAIELTHRLFPPGRAQGVFGAGLVTGVLVARLALGSAKDVLAPDHMNISLDGDTVETRSFKVVIATTLHRFFLGMRPFWGTESGPIRFTAVPEGKIGFGPAIDVLRGRKPRRAGINGSYLSRNVHSSELTIDCGLTIDGEMFAPHPVRKVHMEAHDRVRFVRSD